MIGRSISHFEILEKLGEGGMGTVYKARDTRLGRLVALKVLREDRLGDPERKRRFEFEARAASALNHPNIVTIHEIDHADGVDLIAMEYIRGRTLEAILERGRLPMRDALDYAIQIADALSAAHGAGIIHRDLKPANIMITGPESGGREGLVKILDFGIAKLSEPAQSDEYGLTRTLEPEDILRTSEGTVLGTVAYMSPEQAQGRKLDARSDLFSFGAVLYEMLSGHRTFQGPSKVAVLAAILEKEPKPLAELLDFIPSELDHMVSRCLRKDPERRFQLIKDVRIALEDLKQDSESGRLVPVAAVPRARRRWWIFGTAAAAGVLLLILAVGLVIRTRNSALETSSVRPITADAGLTAFPAISSDGKLVAYASDRAADGNLDIWIQQLAGGQPIRLTRHAADDYEPSFSPDGSQIVFHSDRDGGGIYVMPAIGGEERLLARGGNRPRFSPDGKSIAFYAGRFLAESKIYFVPSAGGPVGEFSTGVAWARNPIWSPEGRRILFLGSQDPAGLAVRDWYLAPAEGGKASAMNAPAVLRLAANAIPPPEDWVGDRVYYGGGNRWTVRLSSSGPISDLQRVTAGSAQEAAPSVVSLKATHSRVTFASTSTTTDLWSLPLERATGRVRGEVRKLTQDTAAKVMPSCSVDCRKLVYSYNGPAGRAVRLRDMSSGEETTLATSESYIRPKLSPDGANVAYSGVGPSNAVYLISAKGGEARKICEGCSQIYGWTPDGRQILFWSGRPIRYSLLDPVSLEKREFLSHPRFNIHGAELSPDGKWVAFHVPISRDREPIFVSPVRDGKAAGESEWIVIIDESVHNQRPWWSQDGKLLYFISTRDGFACIWARHVDPVTKHPVGDPIEIRHFHGARRVIPFGGLANFGPGIAADQIIFSMSEVSGNVWVADIAPVR